MLARIKLAQNLRESRINESNLRTILREESHDYYWLEGQELEDG